MMNTWNYIQDSLTWIEDNLTEKIEIKTLAEMAHLSPFYYQRLFSRLTGKPVMEYLKLRRLAQAADYLAVNQSRIVDAAFRFGFENHETFTRAFKETYGLTPQEYQARPRPLSHFLKPDLSLNYVMVDENVPLAAEGVILEIRREHLENPRFFSGFRVQNPIEDTPGIDYLSELWGRLHARKAAIPGLKAGGQEAGVSTAGEKAGCFSYFAGAETGDMEAGPDFTGWTLPPGDYSICAFEAENFYLLTTQALNQARDYMLRHWLPRHGIGIEPFMAELYGETGPEASSMELWFKTRMAEPARPQSPGG